MKVMKVDKSFEQNLEETQGELADGSNYVGMKVSSANIKFVISGLSGTFGYHFFPGCLLQLLEPWAAALPFGCHLHIPTICEDGTMIGQSGQYERNSCHNRTILWRP